MLSSKVDVVRSVNVFNNVQGEILKPGHESEPEVLRGFLRHCHDIGTQFLRPRYNDQLTMRDLSHGLIPRFEDFLRPPTADRDGAVSDRADFEIFRDAD